MVVQVAAAAAAASASASAASASPIMGATSFSPVGVLLAALGTLVAVSALLHVASFVVWKALERRGKLAPMVWHWIPWVGHHYEMNVDPLGFLRECQAKYGNTFRLLVKGNVSTYALNDMDLVQTMYRGVDRYFDFIAPLKDLGLHITFDTPELAATQGPMFEIMKMRHNVLRRKFMPRMNKFAKSFQPEIQHTMNEVLPGRQGTFSSKPAFRKFVGRMSLRVLCGQELCRNDGLLSDTYDWLDLSDKMSMMWSYRGVVEKMRAHHQKMFAHMRPMIKERRALQQADPENWLEKNKLDDLAGFFMDAYTPSFCKERLHYPPEAADEIVLSSIRSMFFAALGNTVQAVEQNFVRLVADPRAYKEACDEVASVCAELGGGAFEESTLHKLEFLDAAWYEGCRFATPIYSKRMIREKPVPLEGGKYMAPVDTTLGTSPLMIAFDPAVWPRPDEYIPWRMMNDAGKDLRAVGSYSYLSFGAARHACLGRPMATMEFKLTTAELLRKYHFEVLPGPDGKLVPPLDYMRNSVAAPERTIMIRYKLRDTPLGS